MWRHADISLPLCPHQYGQETWSCWHRVEVPGIGAHGEELSLQGLLDQLQVTLPLSSPHQNLGWVGAVGTGLCPHHHILLTPPLSLCNLSPVPTA